MIQTLLAPVDFSTCSMIVTRRAAALAKQLHARLVVLHIAELPNNLSPSAHIRHDGIDQTARDYVVGDTQQHLKSFYEAAAEYGIPVETVVKVGPVVPTILAASRELKTDMIVMGTHGRSGMARLVLGSVAEGVAHEAHVPVLLIRREARPECARTSCEWCPHDGKSKVELSLEVEIQG